MFDAIYSTLSQPETLYLLSSFVGALVLLSILEQVSPREHRQYGMRAVRNSVLLLINTIIKLVIPVSLIAASLFGIFEQFGLLNMVKLGLWTKIIIAWLVLDLFSYGLHRAFHHVGWLWRFHRVHHSDAFLDVTTPFRTHPVELLITLCAKAGIVLLFGMPLLGVILYEIIVAVMAVWIHANLRIADGLDHYLTWFVVTPAYHSQHHGSTPESCKRNFGLVLTVWDRIFGSYSKQLDDTRLNEGASCVPDMKETLSDLLLLPFKPAKR